SSVTVMLSGTQNGSVNTDGNGNFGFNGLAPGGNYSVTLSLSGYTFNPPGRTFTVLSGNQTANFTANSVVIAMPVTKIGVFRAGGWFFDGMATWVGTAMQAAIVSLDSE